jgi:hypothetical protein
MAKKRREVCRGCNGNGWWMAPVYHNERQQETCSNCYGRGWVEVLPPPDLQKSDAPSVQSILDDIRNGKAS